MKRATVLLFVSLAIAAVGWLWVKRSALDDGHDGRAHTAKAAGAQSARAMRGPGRSDLDPLAAAPDGGVGDDEQEDPSDAGGALFDGSTVPELVAESPKSVKFGVVLVRYAGAQGAPPGTRSREEASALAASLVTLAQEDFAAAVEKGDPGSTENAGRMFRGVLEPAPEYVLFSLGKGDVSEPVDTPRGFWIVKRLD